MKREVFIVLILQFFLTVTLSAEEIPLNYIDQPFYTQNLNVEWNLATNPLPATVHLFKIVPGSFSPTAISNLMQLGGFSETDRVRTNQNGDELPANILSFINSNDQRWLSIIPADGTVDLYIPVFIKGLPENVPDKARGYELATNILEQLQIPTAQLPQTNGRFKTWFYPGETTVFPKGVDPITRPSSLGVEFRRMLDGIPCTVEQVHIEFEDHEKMTQLRINWHTVKPSKPYPVASLQTIGDWIKRGRARVQSLSGPMNGRHLQSSDIKKLTIVGLNLYYTASSYYSHQKHADVAMGRLYPYAVLRADAELSPDDHETIWLSCPISKVALSPASKKVAPEGFEIYPSNFEGKQMRNANGSN